MGLSFGLKAYRKQARCLRVYWSEGAVTTTDADSTRQEVRQVICQIEHENE